MFSKKTKKTTIKKPTVKLVKPIKSEPIKLTETLINQALPIIIEHFAKALKALKNGESLRFGKLGSFKKTKREVNGYTGYQYSFKAFSLLKK
jgi:hypothetical protein